MGSAERTGLYSQELVLAVAADREFMYWSRVIKDEHAVPEDIEELKDHMWGMILKCYGILPELKMPGFRDDVFSAAESQLLIEELERG